MTTFDLRDRVIWVTGASRGLGRAIVASIVEAGGIVAGTARTELDLKNLADEVGSDRVQIYPASVDNPALVADVASRIVSTNGRLDGLVNCAGISPSFNRSESLSDEVWSEVLATNLTGTFLCCRAAGGIMLEAGHGSIVNITSVHAAVGAERIAAYAASKGGCSALTKTLAVEWAERGVRVNALAPGYFQTDLSSGLLDSRHGERIRQSVPMKRIGDPRELGPAAVYLLSDAAAYVTGSILAVDGGWQAW